MRKVIDLQRKFEEVSIEDIRINPKSRDDIPQILRGLQHIYTTPDLRAEVFRILEDVVPEKQTESGRQKADVNNGRPGMSQWNILVLGVLRLALNTDYDRVEELANEHNTIRQFLGHSGWDEERQYSAQTIRDNVALFTPELLDRINQAVVRSGHVLLKKKDLVGRCDSFVVETHVHYPTDTNLLLDAVRKIIELSARLSELNGRTEWRQHAYHQREMKRHYRRLTAVMRTRASSPDRQQKRDLSIEQHCGQYLSNAIKQIQRSDFTCANVNRNIPENHYLISKISEFRKHALRQIDQIHRRLIVGERIPHDEKVFSVFQPHTEWVSKGKAGVPVELGLRVCVMSDADGFILHHQVMQRCTDDVVAVPMVAETKERFGELRAVSMDKGFHSPGNQEALRELIETVVLPKKGRLNHAEKLRESDPEFAELRRKHSAVESAINALEVHGLDRCRDHGIDGFCRYTALAVVARNIQVMGAILHRKEADARRRRAKHTRKAA